MKFQEEANTMTLYKETLLSTNLPKDELVIKIARLLVNLQAHDKALIGVEALIVLELATNSIDRGSYQ